MWLHNVHVTFQEGCLPQILCRLVEFLLVDHHADVFHSSCIMELAQTTLRRTLDSWVLRHFARLGHNEHAQQVNQAAVTGAS